MQKTPQLFSARTSLRRLVLAWLGLIAFGLAAPCLAKDESETEEDPVSPSRITPDTAFQRQAALTAEVPASELILLETNYPRQSEPVQVLGLQQEPRKPNAQGAVLILPDKGQHADWPGLVRQLRSALPDSGWYTFSVNLPVSSDTDLPKRSQGPKQNDEIVLTTALKSALAKPPARIEKTGTESEAEEGQIPLDTSNDATANSENVDINLEEQQTGGEQLPSYQERALAHLKAAMDHVTAKGYRNIVMIAIGSSSDLALQYIQPMASEFRNQGFVLILVDAQLSAQFNQDIGEALGEEFQAPVLDIVNGAQHARRHHYQRRKLMAAASNTRTYQQLELPSIAREQEHKTLLKRIDSWLKVHAPGMAAQKLRK